MMRWVIHTHGLNLNMISRMDYNWVKRDFHNFVNSTGCLMTRFPLNGRRFWNFGESSDGFCKF